MAAALGQREAAIMGIMVSPLRGARGNVEFLLHAVADQGEVHPSSLVPMVDAAVSDAAGWAR